MQMDPAVDRWLTWKQHNQGRAVTTVDKYRGYVVRLVEYLQEHGEGRDLRTVLREDLEHFAGLHSHRAGLSPRSRRAMVAALRGFYGWLKREGEIRVNPAVALEYPEAGFKLPVGASLHTAHRLLMAPDLSTFMGVRDAALISVMVGCGVRLSGLCGLNQSSLIWLQDEKGKERLVIKVSEKGRKERLVPAPSEARLLLRAYFGHEELAGIDRTLKDGDQVLFVSLRNRRLPEHLYRGEKRRLAPKSVRDLIVKYGMQQKLSPSELHPHALRHLYGTELAEGEEDITSIQALLGHADPKTSTIYMKLATGKLSKIVDRSGPLGKIKTPVTDLVRRLEQA